MSSQLVGRLSADTWIHLAGGNRRGLSPGAWQLGVHGRQIALSLVGLPVDGFAVSATG